MKIHIISIGKSKNKDIGKLVTEFKKRIRWKIIFNELEALSKLPTHVAKKVESEKLLEVCPEKTFRIALDTTGQEFSSDKLAKKFIFLQQNFHLDLVFFIGGSEGLSKLLLKEADLVLSFGKMTWPHELAKLMLLEQIYRSQCILLHHPYHRLV